MSLKEDLGQVQASAQDLQKDAEGSKELSELAGALFDEKGGNAEKLANAVDSYRMGKRSLSDDEVDIISTFVIQSPAYSKKLQDVLSKGLSYKNARKTAQKLMKSLSYLSKNIPKILKYIGKNNPAQFYKILEAYKDPLDKAKAAYEAKFAVFSTYLKK